MTADRLTGAEIKALLRDRFGMGLIRELAPGGRKEGGLYSALAPHRSDKKIGSFKVYTDARRFGGFVDYGSDLKGDLIDLIALAKGTDKAGALAIARERLGLGALDAKGLRKVQLQAARATKQDEADEEARKARKRARAFELFTHAAGILSPSPAALAVRTYLAGRGIDVTAIAGLTNDVRATMTEHWSSAEYQDGKRLRGGWYGPAMVCAIRNRQGLVTAAHFTFVKPDGSGKAPVPSPKLMLGDVAGGVICLTRGPDPMAEDGQTTVLCEGVEDGLSLAMAEPVRIWAVTSLGNLGNAPIDLPSVKDVVVLQDNDWDKRQALEQFELALERLKGHGKRVAVMSSHIGKDFNDALRSG